MPNNTLASLNYNKAFLSLCIDEVSPFCFRGKIYGMMLSEPLAFTDVNQFLLYSEGIFEEDKIPQAFHKKRTFATKKSPSNVSFIPVSRKKLSQEEVTSARGEECTLILRVTSRQNVSWQGFYTHADAPEGSEPVYFTSALDMLKTIVKSTQKK